APAASDVAVWGMLSSFCQTTVVPTATVSGFTPNAEAPCMAALVPMVTVARPGFGAGGGAGGGDGAGAGGGGGGGDGEGAGAGVGDGDGDGDGAGADDAGGVGAVGYGLLLLLPHADTNSAREKMDANLNDDMRPRDRRALGAP